MCRKPNGGPPSSEGWKRAPATCSRPPTFVACRASGTMLPLALRVAVGRGRSSSGNNRMRILVGRGGRRQGAQVYSILRTSTELYCTSIYSVGPHIVYNFISVRIAHIQYIDCTCSTYCTVCADKRTKGRASGERVGCSQGCDSWGTSGSQLMGLRLMGDFCDSWESSRSPVRPVLYQYLSCGSVSGL